MLAAVALAGCKKGDRDTGPTLDTGWFSTHDSGGCVDRTLEMDPTPGIQDWYYRKAPNAVVHTELQEAYAARIIDSAAVEHPTTLDWNGTQLSLQLDQPLQPDTDYTFELTDCNGKQRSPFRTSSYGQSLTASPSTLQNRTYVYNMAEADWIEPANFGAVIALYFTTPVLVGVQWSNDQNLDLIGTMGFQGPSGDFRQSMGVETWDLPASDFGDKPYFEASGDKVTVAAGGIALDIYDFEISGTFAPDANTIGGTRISGLADTRNMGELIGKKGDPAAMCDLAQTWAIACQPCPDTLGYCMRLTAIDAIGELVPGVTIQQVAR